MVINEKSLDNILDQLYIKLIDIRQLDSNYFAFHYVEYSIPCWVVHGKIKKQKIGCKGNTMDWRWSDISEGNILISKENRRWVKDYY